MQRFCHRKADIAFRLGIGTEEVTDTLIWDFEMGHMDEGSTCTLWAPGYRLAPTIRLGDGFDVTEWPGDRCTSLAEGVGE